MPVVRVTQHLKHRGIGVNVMEILILDIAAVQWQEAIRVHIANVVDESEA